MLRHHVTLVLFVLAIFGRPLPAIALMQPDGTTIPVGTSLQMVFDARGETIDALADAATLPETFTPACGQTVEVVARNNAWYNTSGWYNAVGSMPAVTEMYEWIPCSAGVGTVMTGFDLLNDPNYGGGLVGLYEASGGQACSPPVSDGPTPDDATYLFFTEPAYSPDGGMADPFIHVILYPSTTTPGAFYVAWEDLLVGGDNDFDDLVLFITGLNPVCGDSCCSTGESEMACAADCPPVCGDGFCGATETSASCPLDCVAGTDAGGGGASDAGTDGGDDAASASGTDSGNDAASGPGTDAADPSRDAGCGCDVAARGPIRGLPLLASLVAALALVLRRYRRYSQVRSAPRRAV